MALKTVTVTETYQLPDLVSRVEKGVALLDEKLGPRWVTKVDPKTLDLSSGTSCVVGQLAINAMLNGPIPGGYFDGIGKIFPNLKDPDKRPVEHGFLIDEALTEQVERWLRKQPMTHPWWPVALGKNGTNLDLNGLLYDYLTSIWTQVIKARRAALRTPRKTTAKKTVAKKVAKRVSR